VGANIPSLDTATGIVSIPAGTPAGTYTIKYEICEKLNIGNCDPAFITIPVSAAAIVAQDDTLAATNGANGSTNAGNVLLANGNGPDTLNSIAVTASQVIIKVLDSAGTTGVFPTLDTTSGVVTVPANTPAGSYTIHYQICEELNPGNCDDANVTVPVTAAVIDAVNDTILDIDGTIGNPNAGNVLSNDTLNGSNLTIAQVILTITEVATSIGGAPVPVVSPTGQISVPPGTAAGTYTIKYAICESSNQTNCDSAIVTIEVAVVLGCESIVVHNAFSPNGDEKNAVFIIDNIEDTACYPENTVEIYNRWGVLVFETKNYNNRDKVFDGTSRGRTTISQSSGLPTGTYYYILNYTSFDGNNNIQTNKKDGYLYLTR
jgi:gliding motility-associated-like protein